ncbi:MAG: caspase family protein [Cyanobacteria bacterium P01_C01_bin.89]
MLRNFAIIIGVNAYENGIPPLETAVNDAQAIGELLTKQYGYQVLYLLDTNATNAKILDCLSQLKSGSLTLEEESIVLQEADQVLFYFAGHGVARDTLDGSGAGSPAGFILPQDANINQVDSGQNGQGRADSFIAMQLVHDALVDLPCRHLLLILDCCFAGTFRWAGTTRSVRRSQQIYKERFKRFLNGTAREVITSAAHDEKALDSAIPLGNRFQVADGSRHSPFAERLLTVLSGQEKVYRDLYADGIITANELFVYLNNTLADLTDKQKPGFCQLKGHDKGEYLFLLPDFDPKKLEPAPILTKAANPWMGLKSYDIKDKDLFFGRDRALAGLLEAVKNPTTLIPVIGISGSGKSSLVKAGLIPKLAEEGYQVIGPCRPGERCLESLRISILRWLETLSPSAIAQLKEDNLLTLPRNWNRDAGVFWRWLQRVAAKVKSSSKVEIKQWLFAFDQFEELITLDAVGEGKILLEWLSKLIEIAAEKSTDSTLKIVATLRSDFEGQFQEEIISREDWMASRYVVPALSMEDIRDIVTKPAAERVLYFDPPKLVDRLVEDVAQMPGALPLLSFALSELYWDYLEAVKTEERSDRTLTLAAYEKLGGVTGSLTQRAESVYGGFDREEQETARRILTRMVVPTGELARRRVTQAELTYGAEVNELVQKCLSALVAGGLLVTGRTDRDEEYFEPVHDALVRSWDRLVRWVREDRENLLLQRRLTPAALEWEAQPKSSNWWNQGLDRSVYFLGAVTAPVSAVWSKIQILKRHKAKPQKQSGRDFLWTTEPRLNVLETLWREHPLWFNLVESNFLKESLFQRQRDAKLQQTVFFIILLLLSSGGLFISNFLTTNKLRINQHIGTSKLYRENSARQSLLSALSAVNLYEKFSFIGGEDLQESAYANLLGAIQDSQLSSFYLRSEHEDMLPVVARASDQSFWIAGKGSLFKFSLKGKLIDRVDKLKSSDSVLISAREIAVSKTGKIAIADQKGQVWLLSEKGEIIDFGGKNSDQPIAKDNSGNFNRVVFGENGLLVTGGDGGILRWWFPGSKEQSTKLRHEFIITSIALSQDENSIWVGSERGLLGQWDLVHEKWLVEPDPVPGSRAKDLANLDRNPNTIDYIADNENGVIIVGTPFKLSTITPNSLLEDRQDGSYKRKCTQKSDSFCLHGEHRFTGELVFSQSINKDEPATITINNGHIQSWSVSPHDLRMISSQSTHGGNITSLSIVLANSFVGQQESVVATVDRRNLIQILRLGTSKFMGFRFPQLNSKIVSVFRSDRGHITASNNKGDILRWKLDEKSFAYQSPESPEFIGRSLEGVVTHLAEDHIDYLFRGGTFVSGDSNGTVRRWSDKTGQSEVLWQHSSAVQALDANPLAGARAIVSMDQRGEIGVVQVGKSPLRWSYGYYGDTSRLPIWIGFIRDTGRSVVAVDVKGGWRRWTLSGELMDEGQLPGVQSVAVVNRPPDFWAEREDGKDVAELAVGEENGLWHRFRSEGGSSNKALEWELVQSGRVNKAPVRAITISPLTLEEMPVLARENPIFVEENPIKVVTSDGNEVIQRWGESGQLAGEAMEHPRQKMANLDASETRSKPFLNIRPNFDHIIHLGSDGSMSFWVNGERETLHSLVQKGCQVVKNSYVEDVSQLDAAEQEALRESQELCDRQELLPLTGIASDWNAISKDWQFKVSETLQKLAE